MERRRFPFSVPFGTVTAFVLFMGVMLAVPTVWRPTLYDLISAGPHPPSGWVVNQDDCLAALVPATEQAEISSSCYPFMTNVIIPGQDERVDVLFVLVALGVLSVMQYWLTPAWRIRRRRLRPIHQIASGALLTEIHRTVDEALPESSTEVHIWIDILNPAVGGLAFGHMFRKHIVLNRGMLGLFERDRPLFRAVLMHELAHIRNFDVSVTAMTVAMWRSFLIVVIVPGLFDAAIGIVRGGLTVESVSGLAVTSGTGLAWILAAQLVGLTWLAWLARRSVLQTRELYADARVLDWHPDSPLQQLLDTTSEHRWSVAALRRSTHPLPGTRKATLADSRLLMRQGVAFYLTLGACFSMVWDSMMSPSGGYLRGFALFANTLFLILMTFALVSGVLRAAGFAKSADLLRARLGLASGLAIGWALMPSRITDHAIADFPVTLQVASSLLLAGTGWLLMMWAEWVARPWLSNPRDPSSVNFSIGVPLYIIGFGVFAFGHSMYDLHIATIAGYVTGSPTAPDAVVQAVLVAQWWLTGQDNVGKLLIPLIAGMAIPLVCGAVPWWNTGRSPTRTQRTRPPLVAFVIGTLSIIHRTGAALWRQTSNATSTWRAPRPRHARLLATLVAPAAGLLAAAGSNALDGVLPNPGPAPAGFLALASGVAAALAAATAICAGTAPMARAMLAASVGGTVCLVVLSMAPRDALSPSLAVIHMLEAALLAALAAVMLRHLAGMVAGTSETSEEPDHQPGRPELVRPGQPDTAAHDPAGQRIPMMTATRRSLTNPAPHAFRPSDREAGTTIASTRGMTALVAEDIARAVTAGVKLVVQGVLLTFFGVLALKCLFLLGWDLLALMGVLANRAPNVVEAFVDGLGVLWQMKWLLIIAAGYMSGIFGLLFLRRRRPDVITVDAGGLTVTTSLRSGKDHTLRLQWTDILGVGVVGKGRKTKLVVWFTSDALLASAMAFPPSERFSHGLSICDLGAAFGRVERKELTDQLRRALNDHAGAQPRP